MQKVILYGVLSSILFYFGCAPKALLQGSPSLIAQEEQQKNQQKNQIETFKPKVYHNVHFEYRIAAHDRVQITVYNHPELSTASAAGMSSPNGILIDSSGNVRLPLIGSVHIGGLTQPRAEKKIQSLFGHYLKKSSVHLEVLNKKLFVIGEVKAPGAIKLPNEQMTLLEAISSARGFSDHANKERIIIMRKNGNGTKVELVDLTNISSLGYANMMIRPNDIVYVTSSSMKGITINVMPIFKLAADALLPFIRYQDLTN